jgi:GIY-YIG catalytic domain
MNKNISMKIMEGLKLIEHLDLMFNNPFKCNSVYERELEKIRQIECHYRPNIVTGRVYAICSPNSDFIYIGSTTKPLKRRFWEHMYRFKIYMANATSNYVSSFEIIRAGDAFIIELALIAGTVCQLRDLEYKFIKHTKNCVNIYGV